MKILFVGGGSLGPVTPLIAVAQALKKLRPDVVFIWAGTSNGPERQLMSRIKAEFFPIPVAKCPRYPSWQWLLFPIAWIRARRTAKHLIINQKPDAVISMGGFTAVPVISAAARLHIPCITHQLDKLPGLANKRIARKCQSVTTSFEYKKPPFGKNVKDSWIATPVRFCKDELPSKSDAIKKFGLDPEKPVVLITGGGTGALALNRLVERTFSKWSAFTQVIHLTGEGKNVSTDTKNKEGFSSKAFIEAMDSAYAAADVVVSRAGMGELSEIASLSKAAVLIPIPGSHQEENAKVFENYGAAVVIRQKSSHFDDDVIETCRLLIQDRVNAQEMGERASKVLPTDDGTSLAERVLTILGKRELEN